MQSTEGDTARKVTESVNTLVFNRFKKIVSEKVQAYLIDTAGSVPGQHNKANITIKQKNITTNVCFHSAYKSYVCTLL